LSKLELIKKLNVPKDHLAYLKSTKNLDLDDEFAKMKIIDGYIDQVAFSNADALENDLFLKGSIIINFRVGHR